MSGKVAYGIHARWQRMCIGLWLGLLLAAGPGVHAAGAPAAQGEKIAWLWDGAVPPAWSTGHVAIVVHHIQLRGDKVLQRPRASSPPLPPGAKVTPVVHVDVYAREPPRDFAAARAVIVKAMLQAASQSNSGWVQLDLEALSSQRTAYLALVREIRAALPPTIKLSVTALAWWCRGPQWLDGIAADEVVPMYFRMGAEGARLKQVLAEQPRRLHARCAGTAGFSMQEPVPAAVAARYGRTYWFDEGGWRTPAP